MSLVPTANRLPSSCRNLPVHSHDANSATAASPTLVTAAFSSRALSLLSRKLHSLPRVVPAGLEHQSQDKAYCPVIVFPTADHIYKTDLNMKDVFQPLPQQSEGLPLPAACLGVQTPKLSMLYHCQTLPEPNLCLLLGLSASRGRKWGEEAAEWVKSLKTARGGVFFGGVNAYVSKEGLKNRKGPSLHSCVDSHGLASTEQEH